MTKRNEKGTGDETKRLLRRGAEAERQLLKQEARAERRLADARQELDREQQRLDKARSRVERRLAAVAQAEAALREAQAARAAGPPVSTDTGAADAPADVGQAESTSWTSADGGATAADSESVAAPTPVLFPEVARVATGAVSRPVEASATARATEEGAAVPASPATDDPRAGDRQGTRKAPRRNAGAAARGEEDTSTSAHCAGRGE